MRRQNNKLIYHKRKQSKNYNINAVGWDRNLEIREKQGYENRQRARERNRKRNDINLLRIHAKHQLKNGGDELCLLQDFL